MEKRQRKTVILFAVVDQTKHTEIEWDLLILSRSLAPEREKGCMIMNRKSEMSIGITNGRWISLETINPIWYKSIEITKLSIHQIDPAVLLLRFAGSVEPFVVRPHYLVGSGHKRCVFIFITFFARQIESNVHNELKISCREPCSFFLLHSSNHLQSMPFDVKK